MPVRYVIRPNQDFRGYAGRIVPVWLAAGPAGEDPAIWKETDNKDTCRWADVTTALGGHRPIHDNESTSGAYEVDSAQPAEIADQFRAIVWMQDAEIPPGRASLRTEATSRRQAETASVSVNGHEAPTDTLQLNDMAIATCGKCAMGLIPIKRLIGYSFCCPKPTEPPGREW